MGGDVPPTHQNKWPPEAGASFRKVGERFPKRLRTVPGLQECNTSDATSAVRTARRDVAVQSLVPLHSEV
jgi:hypothetical protein